MTGPSVPATFAGWNVTYTNTTHTLTVTIPAGASLGFYSASYATGTITNVQQQYTQSVGYTARFQVVAAAPTMPAAGNPAFSWQGSVAGVNTGNGNKTTVLPIVGWTMRGGMGVSCALYHNSQGPNYTVWGNKWTPSYFSYISGGPTAPVLHWDNGLTYAYTKNGTAYYPPYGILDTLTYSNGVFTLTTPDQTIYTFGYAPSNSYLSAITDLDGNTLSIGHNPDTTVSFLKDCTGRTLTYSYSGGFLSSITDPLNRVWSFNYGTAGGTSNSNLWYVTIPPVNGQSCSEWFGYDGNSNITAMQTPQGHVTAATPTFGYDGASRLLWAKDPLGNQTTFTYNSDNTVLTDPNGHTTTHSYSASILASVTDALGKISKTTYDYNNIATSTTDKRGNVWINSSHFSNGSNTSTSADPYGNTTTTAYDSKNRVTQSVDPVGNTTAYGYTNNDLTSTSITGTGTTPFKATSTVGGYANGLPTTSTDPLGHSSTVGYDTNGYPNSAVDPANDPASTAIFNALGWKTSSTDANKHTTTYTPDNWGRVTAVTAPDNTQTAMTYDLDGNVKTVTDANNHTVTNEYDADDRLTKTTNGRGDIVTYVYDGNDHVTGAPQRGLLSSKTDGNQHTTYYSYSARNEPLTTYYADGTSESVGYDENGNTISRTKPDGSVIGCTYDKANHLTDITYPHMAATHFDYDRAARKTHMHDATGDTYWDYTYDGVHMTAQTTPQGTVYYGFDGGGRRSVRQLAGTGSWNYQYDANGRLWTLSSPSDGTTTYAYDGPGGPGTKDANGYTQYGLLSRKTKGSGDYELYGYDAADQMTSLAYWFVGGIYQNGQSYTYDPAGNVKTYNQDYYALSYGYDGADQLTSETNTGGNGTPNSSFTFDHNGNRLTQTVNGSVFQNFTYDAHDKTIGGTQGSETDTWYANGNEKTVTIYGSLYSFTYDDEDRLTKLVTPGVTDTYTYNGLGLRVGKTDSTGTYAYVCDGTTPGSPVLSDGHALYTPGLSENRGGTSEFYSFDRIGNLWTLDGTTKNQLGYIDFSGFGGVIASAGSGSPFGFGGANGCQTDPDASLVLMGHRYYDPRTGRFITQDPIGDGDNWYAYYANNPVNAVDPLGLFEEYSDASKAGQQWQNGWSTDGGAMYRGEDGSYDTYTDNHHGGLTYDHTTVIGGFFDFFMHGGAGLNMGHPGMGGFAGGMGRGNGQSSVTTPEGAKAVEQLSEDGVTVGKPGNPFKGVEDAVQKAKQWLGDLGKHVENKDGDHVFMNKAGTKKLRFDIKNPSPHQSPHGHIEELTNGKWRGVGQIYPKDVPPR